MVLLVVVVVCDGGGGAVGCGNGRVGDWCDVAAAADGVAGGSLSGGSFEVRLCGTCPFLN